MCETGKTVIELNHLQQVKFDYYGKYKDYAVIDDQCNLEIENGYGVAKFLKNPMH